MKDSVKNSVLNQGIGQIVELFKGLRQDEIAKILENLSVKTGQRLSEQDSYLVEALAGIEKIKEFVSEPEHILGSIKTKHGEVAEHVDVGISNAKLIIEGLKERFTFEGVGRTAPEDFLDSGIAVQSKFYSDVNKTLEGVLEHVNKYTDFCDNGYYNIPKDQYNILFEALKSDDKKYDFLRELVRELEEKTGKQIDVIIKSSNANYSDVQLNKVEDYLREQEEVLKKQSEEAKDSIKKEAEIKRQETLEIGPSFGEATKVAGVAGLVSGGMNFAMSIRQKVKSGKKLTNFTAQDWKDVGFDTAKGGAKGGVSGYMTYGMVNYLNISAPVASGYTTATFGILNLANKLRKKEITQSEFIEGGHIVCIDSGMATIGAIVGTGLIPVPVLGAVLGSIVGSTMSEIGKTYLNNEENKLIVESNRRFNLEIDRLDKEMQRQFDEINKVYEEINSITDIAFDFNYNYKLRFEKSIDYARLLGVEEKRILKNNSEILNYFLN